MRKADKPIKATNGENAIKTISIALNAVPWVGGILSDVANFYITERQNNRLNDFLIDLGERLQALKDRINRDFVTTEEFKDLTEDIFSKASEARQKEKIEALRNIFINTLLSNKPDYNEVLEIIDLISQWQPRHIILLKILSNPMFADEQAGRVVGEGGGLFTSINKILRSLLPEWNEEQIERTWQDLYDAKIHRTQGNKAMMTDSGIHQLGNRLTNFGIKVANYLADQIV